MKTLSLAAHVAPYLPALKRYRNQIAALAALMFAASMSEGLGIGLFFPLIEYVQHGADFLSRPSARPVIAALAAIGMAPSVGAFIGIIFIVIATALAIKYGVNVVSARIYNPLMQDLREEAFSRIIGSHLFHFTAGSSAELVQVIENEVDYVGNAFTFAVIIAASALSIGVYATVALYVSWQLTLAVAALGALRYAISGHFVKKIHERGLEHGHLRTRMKGLLTAIHQGIDVIKSFGTEDQTFLIKFFSHDQEPDSQSLKVTNSQVNIPISLQPNRTPLPILLRLR